MYVLEVVCEHARLHDDCHPRVVARIGHFPRPSSQVVGWLEWREMSPPEAGYPASMETYFDVARRHGRSTSAHDVRDLVPAGADGRRMGGQRWRFWCSDCRETVPARHEKLQPILEGLRLADVHSVTLAALAPRVGL